MFEVILKEFVFIDDVVDNGSTFLIKILLIIYIEEIWDLI